MREAELNRFVVVVGGDAERAERSSGDRAWRWSDVHGRVRYHEVCGDGVHHSTSGPDLTAWWGTPRPSRGTWSTGRSIADHLASVAGGRFDPHRELSDAYAVVRIDASGRGFVAGDPLGLHPLYLAQGIGRVSGRPVWIVGNGADLVAEQLARHTGQRSRRDLTTALWLAYAGWIIGDGTGFEGVGCVPQAAIVRIEAGPAVRLERRPPLHVAGADGPLDAEAVADRLEADVAAGLGHMAAWSPGRPELELTGGKDSRLVLAVAVRARLVEQFDLLTYGTADLPDMKVARALADTLGARHTDGTARHLRAAASIPRLERLRRHVHRTCGMSRIGYANEAYRRNALYASGHLGELFLATNEREAHSPLTSLGDAARRFPGPRRFGEADLLDPELTDRLEDEARAYYLEPADDLLSFSHLRPAFFARSRLPRWQGPLLDLHTERSLPMYTTESLRSAFRLPEGARADEAVHRIIVERADIRLARQPFAVKRWRREPHTEPVQGASNMIRAAAAERRSTDTELVELVDGLPENPIFDVVPQRRLRSAAAHLHQLGARVRGQVEGAIASAIWLSHSELPTEPIETRQEGRSRVGHS